MPHAHSSATDHSISAPASLESLRILVEEDLQAVNQVILQHARSHVDMIPQLAQHVIASGGKRLRPMLTLACSRLCGYEGENRHVRLAAAVEFIHTATLLHDDVVDDSHLRRGLATANELWGNKASVLVGDYLLSQAFRLMVYDGSLEILDILSGASAVIAEGEVLQLATTHAPESTVKDYLAVISGKTAALFAAACEVGAEVAGKPEYRHAMREFGQNLGIAFQITDDTLDYAADQAKLGKTVGDDFREGKVTLPVIIARQRGNEEERAFWQRTLGEGNQQEGDLEKALELLEHHDALAESLQMGAQYAEQAREALEQLPVRPERAALEEAVQFCLERAY